MDRRHTTELVHVAVVPGSSSGVYYIPLSNLSPSMTFSELRCIARQAASIDKCFIYPNSCEGWIRVRGRTSFLKVHNHLNGLNFKGTVVSASDENEHNAVYIRELKRVPHEAEAQYPLAPGGDERRGDPRLQYAAENHSFGTAPNNSFAGSAGPSVGGSGGVGQGYYHVPVNENTSHSEHGVAYYGGGGYGQQNMLAAPGYDFRYCSSAASSSSAATAATPAGYQYPAPVMGGAATMAAPHSGFPSYAADPHGYQVPVSGYAPQYYYSGMAPTAGGNLRVFVRNLSRHASHHELEAYLLKAAGGRHKLQEDIHFPRMATTAMGLVRQHAFLLFNVHSDALAAIDKLDNAKLLGLVIEARFATDAVLPATYTHTESASTTGAVAGAVSGGTTPTLTHNVGQEAGQTLSERSHNLVVDGSSVQGYANNG